jgi:hypothetical protein
MARPISATLVNDSDVTIAVAKEEIYKRPSLPVKSPEAAEKASCIVNGALAGATATQPV